MSSSSCVLPPIAVGSVYVISITSLVYSKHYQHVLQDKKIKEYTFYTVNNNTTKPISTNNTGRIIAMNLLDAFLYQ